MQSAVIPSEPFAISTCRLCRTADAQINFTDDLSVIDVSCAQCGHFRVEVTGYNLRFDSLTESQRLRVLEFVEAKHSEREASPLIGSEFLKQLLAVR